MFLGALICALTKTLVMVHVKNKDSVSGNAENRFEQPGV